MTVKTTTSRNTSATSDSNKLSMRAAREAHNGLSATLANVRATQDGLTELDACGRLQREGYNEVALRIKDNATGDYVKNAEVNWMPLMHMTMMNHSCPKSAVEKVTTNGTLYEGYIVFQMAQNATEYWDLKVNYTINGTAYSATAVIDVPASTERRVNTFTGTDGTKYIVAYAEPHHQK